MKMGNIKVVVELSQTEYSSLVEGAKLLSEKCSIENRRSIVYSPESFLRYAVNKTLDDLVTGPAFMEN